MNNPSSIAAYYMEELRHEEQELVICMMSDVKGHFLGDKIPVSYTHLPDVGLKFRSIVHRL